MLTDPSNKEELVNTALLARIESLEAENHALMYVSPTKSFQHL